MMTQMLDELHNCLHEQYQPGAFKWADEQLDHAWSHAADRLESVLSLTGKTKDYELLKLEIDFYKNKVLDIFNRYKHFNNDISIKTYLKSLGEE